MSSMDARQPPRFVPTLTDVVAEPALQGSDPLLSPGSAADVDALWVGSQQPTCALPPSSPAPWHVEHNGQATTDAPSRVMQPDWEQLTQVLHARVMQSLESSLQAHLGQALQHVLQTHTETFYKSMHQDMRRLVYTTVHDAVAQELEQLAEQHESQKT